MPQEQSANIIPLARLWCLAAKFRIAKLQNKIISWLQPLTEAIQGDALKEFLCFAYDDEDGMVETSKEKLKKLAVDRMAWGTSAKALGVWLQGGFIPSEMVVDVLLALKGEQDASKQGTRLSARDYYVPVDGEGGVAKVEEE